MLRLTNVSKAYSEGDIRLTALRDVNVCLERDGFTIIVGSSGSGKTTLLNLIGALDRPTTDPIEIRGVDIASMKDRDLTASRATQIGFIFQNFNLLPVLSAYENIEYALMLTRLKPAERARRTRELLDAIGLADHADHRPNQLSGGRKRHVAIARVLVKQPAIVLADEPTANLESATGASIVQLMREMQQRYRTSFIFSTNDPALIKHADDLLIARDGKVTKAVPTHPCSPRAYCARLPPAYCGNSLRS